MDGDWKDFLTFNKRQRNGIIVLLTIIAVLLLFRIVYNYSPVPASINDNPQNKNQSYQTEIQGINQTDSVTLAQEAGINRHLARTLVRYRFKLGGYYSLEQLHEVYGMDSVSFTKIKEHFKIDSGELRKIDINSCSEKELGGHPYVGYSLANVIINYRKQHGEFKNVEDVKNIFSLNDSTFTRVKPYLTLTR